ARGVGVSFHGDHVALYLLRLARDLREVARPLRADGGAADLEIHGHFDGDVVLAELPEAPAVRFDALAIRFDALAVRLDSLLVGRDLVLGLRQAGLYGARRLEVAGEEANLGRDELALVVTDSLHPDLEAGNEGGGRRLLLDEPESPLLRAHVGVLGGHGDDGSLIGLHRHGLAGPGGDDPVELRLLSEGDRIGRRDGHRRESAGRDERRHTKSGDVHGWPPGEMAPLGGAHCVPPGFPRWAASRAAPGANGLAPG